MLVAMPFAATPTASFIIRASYHLLWHYWLVTLASLTSYLINIMTPIFMELMPTLA
jgi:hypothetical protein